MNYPERLEEQVKGLRIPGWLKAISGWLQPIIDRGLHSLREDPDRPEADFVADADYHMIYQEPLRAKILIRTVGVVAALFILMSAVTEVDEITRGEGKVIPSRQLRPIFEEDVCGVECRHRGCGENG